jgi:hypothetical protein
MTDESSFFCKTFLSKPHYHIENVITGKQYSFVGNLNKKILRKMQNNIDFDKDIYNDISSEEINQVYVNTLPTDQQKRTNSAKKIYLTKQFKKNHKLIFDSLNKDDTITTILQKINNYCCESGLTYDYLCAYTKTKDNYWKPLGFRYNKQIVSPIENLRIDDDFVNLKGEKRDVHIQTNYNELFEETICTQYQLYFMTVYDFLKHFGVKQTNYTKETWPSLNGYTFDQMFNGCIRKYWPRITDETILLNTLSKDKLQKRRDTYEHTQNILKTTLRMQELIETSYQMNSYVPCDYFKFSLLKLSTPPIKDTLVDIISLFSQEQTDESIPFLKLVLDSYENTYYKLDKTSLDVNGGFVTNAMCRHWIRDLSTYNELGYHKYQHSDYVYQCRLFRDHNQYKLSCTLTIHKHGLVEFYLENTEDIPISQSLVLSFVKDCNEYIKYINRSRSYSSADLPLFQLDFFRNIHSETKIDEFNCEFSFLLNQFQKKNDTKSFYSKQHIQRALENLCIYTRNIDEKYLYKTNSILYTRYKRVNNYNNNTTVQSIISTLSNPKLNLSKDEICKLVSKQFDISSDDSIQAYNEWMDSNRHKLLNHQKVYTLSTNEPGIEMNIFRMDFLKMNEIQGQTNPLLCFECNGFQNFSEVNRVCIFIKVLLQLYKDYLQQTQGSLGVKYGAIFETNIMNIQEMEDEFIEDTLLPDDGMNAPILSVDEQLLLDEQLLNSTDQEEIEINMDNISTESSTNDEVEINMDDITTDSSSQSGGAGEAEASINITRYYMKRLNTYDKKLFTWDKNKYDTKDYKPYSTICQAHDDRQPNVVTDQQLSEINNSSDIGSGRNSYSNVIRIGTGDEKYNYICPKYWDVSRYISLDPMNKNWNKKDHKIIQKTKGEVTNTVLERKGPRWKSASNVEDYEVRLLETSRHPLKFQMPCCYNKKTTKQITTVNKNYITTSTPAKDKKYGYLHKALYDFMGQTSDYLSNDSRSGLFQNGFLKQGVASTNESFLLSVLNNLNNDYNETVDIDDFKQVIIDSIQESQFQEAANGELFQIFMKHNEKQVSLQVGSVCEFKTKGNAQLQGTIVSFSKKKVQIQTSSGDTYSIPKTMIKTNPYTQRLQSSYENYLDYIEDNTIYKKDIYIEPILKYIEGLQDCTIVIFDIINEQVQIKLPFYPYYKIHKKLVLIQKVNIWYEPILFRVKMLKTNKMSRTKYIGVLYEGIDPFLDKVYQKVVQSIKPYDIYNNPSPLIKVSTQLCKENLAYQPISQRVDSFNKVTHIITKSNYIIPISPSGIQHSIVIQNTNITPKVITNLPQSIYPSYDAAMLYMKPFSYKVHGIVIQNSKVVDIVFHEGLFIPIIPETYNRKKHKYPMVGNKELLLLNDNLLQTQTVSDSRIQFMDNLQYESKIYDVFHRTLLHYLYEPKNNVKKTGFVKNYKDFINQSYYQLSPQIITIKGKDYTLLDICEVPTMNQMNAFVHKVVPIQSPQKEQYPFWGRIYYEYKFLEEIDVIRKNEIRLYKHKQMLLYPIIDMITNRIIHIETKQSDINQTNCVVYKYCSDPCKPTKQKKVEICQLKLQETSPIDGSKLLDKCIWKFIELILKEPNKSMDELLQFNIELHELESMIQENELLFRYQEPMAPYIDHIFETPDKYIQDELLDQTKFRQELSKQRDEVMYRYKNMNQYLSEIFRETIYIEYPSTDDTSDFYLLSTIINETLSYDSTKESIKQDLLSKIQKIQSLDEYNSVRLDTYETKQELIQDATQETYAIQPHDLFLLSSEYKLGFLLITHKYNEDPLELHPRLFMMIDPNIMNYESVPIVILFHDIDDFTNAYILTRVTMKERTTIPYNELFEKIQEYDIM